MHFRSLLAVYLPEITPDPEWEKDISTAIEELKALYPGIIMDNELHGMRIEGLTINQHRQCLCS